MATSISPAVPARFELRFAAAGPGGHDYVFPCDERGLVDLDTLPERQRCDYFFARALVGRDVERPVVVSVSGPAGGALADAARWATRQ